ncbi:MAG: C39 family peptidase [Chloroflexia bacterium]
MIRPLFQGAAISAPRTARRTRCLLLVCLLFTLFAPALGNAEAAASGPAFPPYIYVVVSGPSSYDVMRNAGGKETRLSRVATAGVGFSEVAAHQSPDGGHVAIRVSGDRSGGSSLRVQDVGSWQAITVTLSRSGDMGIGAFAWSPDSRSLAYTVAAPQRDDADSGSGSLWVVSSDARGARKLTVNGKARLIGWSPDGTGLYYARQGDADTDPSDLWFLPLSGPAIPVLRSGPGGLQWSNFAVAPAPMQGTPGWSAHIAGLAAGNLGLLPYLAPLGSAPQAPRGSHVAPPETPGVIAGIATGGLGTMRDLGEAYSVLAWSPDGTHLLFSGGKSNTAWYADVNTGQRWKLSASLNKMAPISWSADSRYVLLGEASGPIHTLITLDTATSGILRTRWPGATEKAGATVKDLALPYVNQVWHTGVAFNGNWACGPTSVAMVLAYYGRLAPWPFAPKEARLSAQTISQTVVVSGTQVPKFDLMDGTLYGQYVVKPFVYKGQRFSAPGTDPSGHKVQGLYGTIVGNTGLAHWETMISVLGLYDLNTGYIPATWYDITAAINKGYPVVLGTTLTSAGHILVARGYTANGYLLMNDPYGNHAAGYGGDNGGNVAYAWKDLPVKLAMVVRGTVQPPPPPVAQGDTPGVPTPTPTPTPPPSTPVPSTPVPNPTRNDLGGP